MDSLRGVVIELLQREPLEDVIADASLERNEYHKLALHQLDKLDDAEALYQIGDRITQGIGIKENWNLGYCIVIEAARRGHPVALGVCFLKEQGVEKNNARAFDLFRASADRGHASGSRTISHSISNLQFSQSFTAQCWLGECHFHGYGVEKNKQEAIRVYRAAALQCYARAQFLLGYCYRDGKGAKMNKVMSACLNKMAADNGDQDASFGMSSREVNLNKVMLADVRLVMCRMSGEFLMQCAMQRAMQALKQEKKHCNGCSRNATMKSQCWYVI